MLNEFLPSSQFSTVVKMKFSRILWSIFKMMKFLLLPLLIQIHLYGSNNAPPPPDGKGEMFQKMAQKFKHDVGFDSTFVQLKKRYAQKIEREKLNILTEIYFQEILLFVGQFAKQITAKPLL